MDEKITIELTKDEALVLFDFLGHFNEVDHSNVFEDQAEQKTLWKIEGQLEKILGVQFDPNYTNIVKQARDRIRDIEV